MFRTRRTNTERVSGEHTLNAQTVDLPTMGLKEKPVVLSWLAHVEWQETSRPQSSFEVLVRHLFARLLSSLSLDTSDNASAGWTVQVAYAAALPTLLFALYLFPAYHQPGGKPVFWVQTSHHFFYVNAAFALSGLATVLLSDALFPDALDALILTSLPIAGKKLLLARALALTLLLGGILLELSLPGILFLPAVADLPVTFPLHFIVHALAVLTAGLCAMFAVCALQGIVICCFSRRTAQAISPILQTVWVLLFTMLLVLEPLIAHLLPLFFASSSAQLHSFPPFWFLGIYEHLLLHTTAPSPFNSLAKFGFLATSLVVLLALITYPFACIRRTRQVIEGATNMNRTPSPSLFAHLLASTLLKDSRRRAIFCWISQTLPRTQRTRLLLTFFAALILAAPSAVVLLRLTPETNSRNSLTNNSLLFEIARLAVPAAAALSVLGLRTVLRAPVAQTGAWAFRLIYGLAKAAHSQGMEIWTAGCACLTTLLTALLVYLALPPILRVQDNVASQVILAIVLPILLTDVFFLPEHASPFTELRTPSVNDLSITVVTCFALLPTLVFGLVAAETWFESTWERYALALTVAASIHAGLRRLRAHLHRETALQSDLEDESLLPGEIGLRS